MDKNFFIGNRAALIDKLNGGLVVLTAFTKMQSAADSAAPFQQEASFWYLTGIEHPDWWLIIDGGQNMSWLVAPEVDEVHQLFDGSLSVSSARAISGVDGVLGRQEGEQLLQDLAKKHATVYTLGVPPYADHADFILNPAPKNLRKELQQLFDNLKDCQEELMKLRAIKQPEEIEAIKEAVSVSVAGFERAKEAVALDRYEYEIEAELAYCFRRQNAVHAFEPIVASGKNACTLHYVRNDSKLQPNELLLIDAGASVGGYPADITRTFAVGPMSARQRAVHSAVKGALEQIITLIQPGISIKSYIDSTDAIMKDSLLALGLIKNKNDTASYRRYFPHAISHGLGLEVHESLGGYKEFRPGMVLTVEPGIYIPEESIGVRIEDDILVTDEGNENLTAGLSTDY